MTFEVSLVNPSMMSEEAKHKLAKYWHYSKKEESFICLSAESLVQFGMDFASAIRGQDIPMIKVRQLS